jgi:hypothetical protein
MLYHEAIGYVYDQQVVDLLLTSTFGNIKPSLKDPTFERILWLNSLAVSS